MFDTFELLQEVMRNSHKILGMRLEPFDLYKGQPKVLKFLYEHDGANKKSIANRFNIAMPTVTKMIERLEKKEFVTSKTDENDKRKTLVYLTEKGRETHEALYTFKKDYADIVFDGINEEDLELLKEMLEKMNNNAKEYKKQYEKTY